MRIYVPGLFVVIVVGALASSCSNGSPTQPGTGPVPVPFTVTGEPLMVEGETVQWRAQSLGAAQSDVTATAVWSSSDSAIASVSSSGVVTAVKAGEARITASNQRSTGTVETTVVRPYTGVFTGHYRVTSCTEQTAFSAARWCATLQDRSLPIAVRLTGNGSAEGLGETIVLGAVPLYVSRSPTASSPDVTTTASLAIRTPFQFELGYAADLYYGTDIRLTLRQQGRTMTGQWQWVAWVNDGRSAGVAYQSNEITDLTLVSGTSMPPPTVPSINTLTEVVDSFLH